MQTSFRRRACFYRQQRRSFFLSFFFSFYLSYNIFVRDRGQAEIDLRLLRPDDQSVYPTAFYQFRLFDRGSFTVRDLFIILFVKTTDRVENNLCNRDLETKRTVNRQANNTYNASYTIVWYIYVN